MIHNPMTIAMGDAAEMQKAIEMLEGVKDSIINAYELKTGMSRAKISHLMDSETWMDAYKAVELGFADDILFRDAEKEPEDEPDEDEEAAPDEPKKEPDKDNPFKKNHRNAMLYSRKDADAELVNKLAHYCQSKPENKTGRSVDSLMERLNLIKKHI